MTMPETTPFTGGIDVIELGFVDCVFTPKWAMKPALKLHLSGLSLSNIVSILDTCGVHRCQSTVHNWVQKADLALRGGSEPTKIASTKPQSGWTVSGFGQCYRDLDY